MIVSLTEDPSALKMAVAGSAEFLRMGMSASPCSKICTFLTICQQYKIPATAIMAVSDDIISGEMGFMDTNYYMAEHAMIGISLELVKKLEGKA